MADDDEKSNWTIKNVPVHIRKRALDAATKQQESVATWLSHAVLNEANREANTKVYLPDQPGQRSQGQPANHTGPTPLLAAPDHLGQPDMAALSDVMRAAVEVCASAGVPVPKSVARQFVGLLNGELRTARGLPPLKPRKGLAQNRPEGQPFSESGQPLGKLQNHMIPT